MNKNIKPYPICEECSETINIGSGIGYYMIEKGEVYCTQCWIHSGVGMANARQVLNENTQTPQQ